MLGLHVQYIKRRERLIKDSVLFVPGLATLGKLLPQSATILKQGQFWWSRQEPDDLVNYCSACSTVQAGTVRCRTSVGKEPVRREGIVLRCRIGSSSVSLHRVVCNKQHRCCKVRCHLYLTILLRVLSSLLPGSITRLNAPSPPSCHHVKYPPRPPTSGQQHHISIYFA